MTNAASIIDAPNKERPADHNQEVARALKEYCHFSHAQGFAVMLSGPWGSGKSHFIESILTDLVPPGKNPEKHKPLRVSLYGLTSPAEISDRLFEQLHPILGHKITRLVGAALRSTLKTTIKFDLADGAELNGTLPEVDLSAMMRGTGGRVVIFDDFERAVMSPSVILGYINPLVEHDDCKVLIIAAEEEISDQGQYSKRKEKTVGRTFEFKADAEAAFAAFLGRVDDEQARRFIAKSKVAVLEVFADSGFDNLRLLQQSLWDLECLCKALTGEQRRHEKAMQELVPLVCAAAIELRSGKLTAEMFRRNDYSHHFAVHVGNPKGETTAVDKIFKKYRTVRFDSTLLEPAIIVDLILKSKVPVQLIRQQLQQHPYFAKPEEMPSWRALVQLGRLSPEP
ncbi:hypothetical protein F7D13_09660 [Methylocystis rosea]|uniref:KAP NTPase domain-containing protein n=1 Tax=Methylocystis rosea TaxID=173366 RepID=A0ABX6EHN3_9HYPH|nr:P-loop NTPase fold protein [Methylocystis rosea]QGM94273.1 hypothetical protein F7D13_09660 [Methylocystis rosea]